MGRAKSACRTCAAIKAKCSTGRPCSRCQRLHVRCTYPDEHDSSPLASAQTERGAKRGAKGRFKVWHRRSAHGCCACRRKRKKCDEKLPNCGSCERSGILCLPRRPPSPTLESPSSPSPFWSHDNTLQNQAIADVSTLGDSLGLPSLSSLSHSIPQSNRHDVLSSSSIGGQLPTDPTDSTQFLDWVALLENDSHVDDTKTLDLAKSTALAKLPMPCAVNDAIGLATYLPPTALNNLTGTTPFMLTAWTVSQRHLLNHFLQSVCRALVVVPDEENPFFRTIVPLALEYSIVKHAVLALSACHLGKVYPEWGHDTLVHRSSALSGLKEEVENPTSITKALATTLTLCLVEICEGNSKKWMLHLHGAKALLATVGNPTMITPADYSLVDLFNSLCFTASLTTQKIPVPILTSDTARDSVRTARDVHPFMGLAAALYEFLWRISTLAIQLESLSPGHNYSRAMHKIQELENAVQSWSPGPDSGSSRFWSELRAAAFATQSAILIHIQQVMRRSTMHEAQLKRLTDNILSALSVIRPGSAVEAHILFPLFMAGVESVTKVDRLSIEYRLNAMETTLGSGNIFVAHQLLDELWQRANQGESVDWHVLAVEKYPSLVLF